jgi:hypothetical protein
VSKLPEPPSAQALRERAPLNGALHTLDTDAVLWRIHPTVGEHVLPWNELRHWGPAAGRFDPHNVPPGHDPAHGVLYVAAAQVGVAVTEAFQRTRRVDVTAGGPWLTGLQLTRPLALLDLTGPWATRAGASQAISTGPRPRAQRWARVIAAAWPALDGIWYRSSMLGGGRCAAVWTLAADAIPARPLLSMPLSHPALWGPLAVICERVGYRLA